MFINSIIFVCMFSIIFKFFDKKIMVLLGLEGLMLSVIIFMVLMTYLNFVSFFMLVFLSVFMVLDSVFGISLLISSSRCSSWSMKMSI